MVATQERTVSRHRTPLPATLGLAAEALALAANVLETESGTIQDRLEIAMDAYLRLLVADDFTEHLTAEWLSVQDVLSRRPLAETLTTHDAEHCAGRIILLRREVQKEILRGYQTA